MGLAQGHKASDSPHSPNTSKCEALFPGPRVTPISGEKRHLDFVFFLVLSSKLIPQPQRPCVWRVLQLKLSDAEVMSPKEGNKPMSAEDAPYFSRVCSYSHPRLLRSRKL